MIDVYYEHPRWFDKVFAELDRRRTPYRKVLATDHTFEPGAAHEASVIFNRMSPSAYNRGAGDAIVYTTQYLADAELAGVRVINGSTAFAYEISKARQLSLIASLGLPGPRTRVVHRIEDVVRAAEDLRYPIVVKPNVGGSGEGVTKFASPDHVARAIAERSFSLGFDSVGLVQEFIPARGGRITRVEAVGGKVIYAIDIHINGETFDLCPADICQTGAGVALENACAVEAPKMGLKVDKAIPSPAIVDAVERIVREARIDVGGIEFMLDDRDGKPYFYDVNALSNFVADAPRVIGFDPFETLGAFLESELHSHGLREPALSR